MIAGCLLRNWHQSSQGLSSTQPAQAAIMACRMDQCMICAPMVGKFSTRGLHYDVSFISQRSSLKVSNGAYVKERI
jgi:hypothetical protein